MNDTFNLLTQVKKGQSHRETKVTICWDNITEQQLKTMGRAFIIHVLQSHWKGDAWKVPEQVTIQATTMIHAEVFIPKEYVPRKKLSPFAAMLKDLSPEELQSLMNGLE